METQNIYFDGKSVGTLKLLGGITDIALDGSNPEIASLIRRVNKAVENVGLGIILDGWHNDEKKIYYFEVDAMPEQVWKSLIRAGFEQEVQANKSECETQQNKVNETVQYEKDWGTISIGYIWNTENNKEGIINVNFYTPNQSVDRVSVDVSITKSLIKQLQSDFPETSFGVGKTSFSIEGEGLKEFKDVYFPVIDAYVNTWSASDFGVSIPDPNKVKELTKNENTMRTLKLIGIDNSYPVYEDQNGKLWKDVNLGNGKPQLSSTVNNNFFGEPDSPMRGNFEIIPIVDELKNNENVFWYRFNGKDGILSVPEDKGQELKFTSFDDLISKNLDWAIDISYNRVLGHNRYDELYYLTTIPKGTDISNCKLNKDELEGITLDLFYDKWLTGKITESTDLKEHLKPFNDLFDFGDLVDDKITLLTTPKVTIIDGILLNAEQKKRLYSCQSVKIGNTTHEGKNCELFVKIGKGQIKKTYNEIKPKRVKSKRIQSIKA